ncbi:O-antigen ligase family protein [Sphingomonas abietis]|uniref:O-antigen ligase family protein n=1 Tax=Sphingomonas abietis TaxID=3012344 RepID=A0ABY7NH25_9SPHN|nr:O-antigen ligase family protein [Sphingomonas abietis]WBO20845.1 O-antigen ligase family protein [Sphingomonas abietis]
MTRSQEIAPKWSEYLAILTFAMLIGLTLLGPWMTIRNEAGQNLIRQAGYGTILLLALVAMRPWRHPERLLVVPWPILLALVWCWLTLLWAIDPAVGMRRLVLTTIIAWSLFALVRQLGAERTVAVLRFMLVAMLVVNFFVVLAYPTIGVHLNTDGEGFGGKWRGLMAHKNYAGMVCAITILFFAFDAAAVHRMIRIIVCVAAAVFLVMSDSRTSMGIGVAAIMAGLLFTYLAGRNGQHRLASPALAWLLLIIPAVIFVSMAIDNAPYLQMVSDPSGFTGRTQIWAALIKAYADHPWLGVGYGSFWDLGSDGPIFRYASGWVTDMSEGHNGYLDLLVQTGCIGAVLVLYAVLVWPARRLLHGGNHPARALGAALVIFCVGHNFTESQLFDRDALAQVFLMIAIALLWAVTAAPIGGTAISVPDRRHRPVPPRAPLRL